MFIYSFPVNVTGSKGRVLTSGAFGHDHELGNDDS